jgi:hypothetical protein
MTRVWALTTVCCAVLALPTIARLVALALPAGASWPGVLGAGHRVGASVSTLLQSIATWSNHTLTTAFGSGSAPATARAHATVARTEAADAGSERLVGLPHIVPDLTHGWRSGMSKAIELVALVAALMVVATLVADRLRQHWRAAAPHRARRLAERGAGVGVIARRTGLPQDAVRQLIHPQLEVGAGFSPPADRAAFADLLTASLDPTLAPSTGSRSDR